MTTSIISGNEYGTVGGNRSYVFPNKGNTTLQSDNAGNGHQLVLTDRVYIQPNKNMWVNVSVLGELTITSSGDGGGYIQINAKINDTWFDLGNSGSGGIRNINGLGSKYRYSIRRFIDFDLIPDLGANRATTIQIEVLAFFRAGATYVLNTKDGINGLNLAGRGDLYMPAAEQNYTNVTLIEQNRA